MTPEEYLDKVLNTESNNFEEIRKRLHEVRTIRLLHAAMGMCTEAAEMLDALKKFIFYGEELDLVNIKEELGDGNWYEAIAIHEIGSSFEEIFELNIAKLAKRYGIKFNNEGAISRDLSAERYVLEKNSKDDEINLKEVLKELSLDLDEGLKSIPNLYGDKEDESNS